MSESPANEKNSQPDLLGFWGTARHNCALIDHHNIDLIVSLAHGGMLSAKVTEVAWPILSGQSCPSIVYTNIGREKQAYYYEWCRANGVSSELNEVGITRKQVDRLLLWTAHQEEWLDELKGQIETMLGEGTSPTAILVVDEMFSSTTTLWITTGLLRQLYPECPIWWSDSPYFDWRNNLADFWLQRHYPDILERMKMDFCDTELWPDAPFSLGKIASGTEDIDPHSLSFRPLSVDNQYVQMLTQYLPAEEWLAMPRKMEQYILDGVAAEARRSSLDQAREQLARYMESWVSADMEEHFEEEEIDDVDTDVDPELLRTMASLLTSTPREEHDAGLWVPVVDDFRLNAGEIDQRQDRLSIRPPKEPLFGQLCAWLGEQPDPAIGYPAWALGIGATALCLRWGTYLCVLLDESKPVDPRAADSTVSMIDDQEMMRINLEASANLARLLVRLHTDEVAAWDLLRRAYAYLPMPQRRVARNTEACEQILSSLTAFYRRLPASPLPEYPYRTLANAIINLAYRNGPIEAIHAGRVEDHPLESRRMTSRQAGRVMRFTAERLAGIIGACPFWDERFSSLPAWPRRVAGLSSAFFYPRAWSLTQENAGLTWPPEVGR